jgi:hypothetical protein
MTTPVHAEPKQPVQSSHPAAPAAAASAAPEIKDNLTVREGVVLDPNASKPIFPADIPEEAPLLDSPENFQKKKKVVSEESINFFELLLAQSKINIETRRESIESRQKGLGHMQEAQKESAKDMDKKIDEQTQKQSNSSAKSGFLGIFSKVFTALTAVIGVAMLFVPGMQVFGVLMLVGAAVGVATQIPGVMEGLGKMFTALLTPILGKELAEKVGPIVAAIYVAVVQIALAVAGPAAIGTLAAGAMRLAATALKYAATAAGTVQGGVQGGVGIALGVNNIDLAKITKAVESLTGLNDLLNTQVQQTIDAINQNYKQMSADLRRSSQAIDSIPTFQVA